MLAELRPGRTDRPSERDNSEGKQTPEFDPGALRLKNRRPSESMLPSVGLQYECPWIGDSITIQADGNVSCGLDDPHAKRSYGNVYEQTIAEIYANAEFDRVRENLRQGLRCDGCNLFQPVADVESEKPKGRPSLPSTIVVETTVNCNLRCDNAACNPNNAPGLLTRHSSHLEFAKFTEVIDQLKDTLQTVYFFNYGEPFLHPRAEDMLLYLREACPNVRIVTSTNGIPLARTARAEKAAVAAINSTTFTIGGITQQSYSATMRTGRSGWHCRVFRTCATQRHNVAWKTPRLSGDIWSSAGMTARPRSTLPSRSPNYTASISFACT